MDTRLSSYYEESEEFNVKPPGRQRPWSVTKIHEILSEEILKVDKELVKVCKKNGNVAG